MEIQFTGHALMQTSQSLHFSSTWALSSLLSESAQTGHMLTHPPHPVHTSVLIVTIVFLLCFWCDGIEVTILITIDSASFPVYFISVSPEGFGYLEGEFPY